MRWKLNKKKESEGEERVLSSVGVGGSLCLAFKKYGKKLVLCEKFDAKRCFVKWLLTR